MSAPSPAPGSEHPCGGSVLEVNKGRAAEDLRPVEPGDWRQRTQPWIDDLRGRNLIPSAAARTEVARDLATLFLV